MKQHYIPRCYLRRFSDNDKSIYAYDKISSKSYRASLMSVCCHEDMYTLSDEYVNKTKVETGGEINNLSIEKDLFAKDIEPLYSQLLSQIDDIKDEWISDKGQYRLNYCEKKEIALHIATQYLRHPQIGDAEVDNYMRFEQAGIDMLKHILAFQEGNDDFENLEVKAVCEKPALHAILTYMNYEEVEKCASMMANNIFVFRVSNGNDFYTSDFPIAVESHAKYSQSLYCGLIQYGGEVTMPLSPSLFVSIYDSQYFKDKKELDGCFVEAEAKEMRRQNLIRYFYASRHVFSSNNDFSLIESFYRCNGNKHEFMKPHLKAEVVSGLGRY
ncbi:MAG: DUF4238 domain-containing protein [Bacteroidales bacterium]|nr:DUF4238 domain-containing protein [Bacteroidales bacterium]